MQQLLYSSISTGPPDENDLAAILLQSRRNNAAAGITGLLWAGHGRFVQVIEGPPGAVESLLDRLRADGRHRGITVHADRLIASRSFGRWRMALYADRDTHIAQALREADPLLRDDFLRLIVAPQ